MKRFLTAAFAILMTICSIAQVRPIQTGKNPYEYVASHVFYDHRGKYYELSIQSDNRYEDRYFVKIKLGKSTDEAVQSLLNILDAYKNVGERFSLKGYEFGIRPDELHAYKSGKLTYAAGEYNLHISSVRSAIFKLLSERGATMGNIRVFIDNSLKGAFTIVYDDYGFDYPCNIYRDILPYLSHEYTEKEELSSEDARNLLSAFANGSLPQNKALINIFSHIAN